MREYRFNHFVFLNYIPVIIFEGLLIFTAFYMKLFQEVLIVISIIIFIVSVFFFIRQTLIRYDMNAEGLIVKTHKRVLYEIKFVNIRQIVEKKRSIEITFKHKKKMKTVYLNWFIKGYREFLQYFLDQLKTVENFSDINYIV